MFNLPNVNVVKLIASPAVHTYCKTSKFKIILGHGSLVTNPTSEKNIPELTSFLYTLKQNKQLLEEIKDTLDEDKKLIINNNLLSMNPIIETLHNDLENYKKFKINQTFRLKEGYNLITLVKVGTELKHSRIFETHLKSFYNAGNTIFNNEDKTKGKENITEMFLNFLKSHENLFTINKDTGEKEKFLDGIYIKNRLAGQIVNNLMVSFHGNICNDDTSRTDNIHCGVFCSNGNSDGQQTLITLKNNNNENSLTTIERLMNAFGPGSYIIITCRSCDLPPITEFARQISDGKNKYLLQYLKNKIKKLSN